VSRRLGWLALGGLVMACPDEPQVVAGSVLRWMQCQECIDGERAAVVAMGDSAVPDLRRLLIDGPPADFVDRVRAEARTPLQRPTGVQVPPQTFVERVVEDFRSSYRVRASSALGLIGGPAAIAALCAGRAQSFGRREVRAAIDSALVLVSGSCP